MSYLYITAFIIQLKFITTILLLFQSTYFLSGQTLDTINIYQNKSGVPFKMYQGILSPKGDLYNYSHVKLNKQDSIVLIENPAKKYYLKVFDSNNSKLFEGERSTSSRSMNGDVKFYRKDQTIERIETWGSYNSATKDSLEVFASDSPSIITTKYFSKQGVKTKQIETFVDLYSTKPLRYCIINRVIVYNKSGGSKTKDTILSCEK